MEVRGRFGCEGAVFAGPGLSCSLVVLVAGTGLTLPVEFEAYGPGVVIDGSATVMINNLSAARQGDTLLEAIGPPDQNAMGMPTVLIRG